MAKNKHIMCDDSNCPLKDNCQRYMETIDKVHIDHFAFSPYKKGRCSFHTPLTEDDIIDRIQSFINKKFN